MLTQFQNRIYQDAQLQIPKEPSHLPGTSILKGNDFCRVLLHFSYETYNKQEAEYIGALIAPLVSKYCQKEMMFKHLDEPTDNVPTVIGFWFYTK